MTSSPTLTILSILTIMGLLIASSSVCVVRGYLGGESARKLVHVGMGIICAFFPWIFNAVLQVQVLGAVAVFSILIIRCSFIRQHLGASLFSVSRISVGELLFPIAIAWLFTLYKINEVTPVFYVIPILLLTLADTAGAIFGTRIGKRIYKTASGSKSVEGSIAFFLTALLCTVIPLYFFTTHDFRHIIFASFAVALFFTIIEGASGAGVDNLLIPIGSYFLLIYYLEQSSESLWLRASVLFFILLLFILTRTWHSLNGGAAMSASLLCFIAFIMGGIFCLAASLMLLIRHMVALKKTPDQLRHTHSIEAVVAVGAPAVMWLTLGRSGVIDMNLSRLLFIATLAVTIAALHLGTIKYLKQTSLTFRQFLKANLLGAGILFLTLPIAHNTSFYSLVIPFMLLSSLTFHSIRSYEPNLLSDWAKLYFINSLCSLSIYYAYTTTN